MAVVNIPFTDLDDDWDAANRYTAAADISVDLSNSAAYDLFFIITDSDVLPNTDVRRARPVKPMEAWSGELEIGDRLWIAGKGARALLMAG